MKRIACLLILAMATQGCYTTQSQVDLNRAGRGMAGAAQGIVLVGAVAITGIVAATKGINKAVKKRRERKAAEAREAVWTEQDERKLKRASARRARTKKKSLAGQWRAALRNRNRWNRGDT